MITDISKRLLELEFKRNYSIKSKFLKGMSKNCYLQYKDLRKTRPRTKPIKTGKELETKHCLGCKDYNHNFKPHEVKMTNKSLRGKPNCVVCRSSKSRFLKQKQNNKK